MKKEKMKENKIYKWFRRISSLGLGGAITLLFPNVIITNASMWAGYVAGKGLISFATATAIATFLGSALGLVVQKAVVSGLTFLISNCILKQGGKIVKKISSKIHSKKNVERINEVKNDTKKEQVISTKEESKDLTQTSTLVNYPTETKQLVKH